MRESNGTLHAEMAELTTNLTTLEDPRADEHLQVLEAVQDIGEAFASTLQLQPVLERIIFAAMQLVDGDAGSVMLLTDDGEWLVVKAAIGPRSDIILGQRQPANASIGGQALMHNQPIL